MSEERETRCLLKRDPKTSPTCKPSECVHCGWDETEAACSNYQLKKNGLTLCEDGLRRLVIHRNIEEGI